MKPKRYYVYAGYYEVWISDRILRQPLAYQGWHRTLAAAIRHASRMDPETICFDQSLRREVIDYYGFPEAWNPCLPGTTFFNGKKHSIRRGLTQVTLERMRCAPTLRPCAQDLHDILQLLHLKTGTGLRRLFNIHREDTYCELQEVLAKVS